jgi:hypothetical protein
MQFVIRDVESQLFQTRSSIAGTRLVVELSGCLDMDTTPLLKTFLEALIRDIQAGIVAEFEFHTRELYLMSSSSISCFASWIKQLKLLSTKCTVLFRTNPDLDWQRRTLDPIRRLALQLVSID